MHDTPARVALVNKRVRQLRRRREKRAAGALGALCLALLGSLVGTMSLLTRGAPAAESGMYGSMLLYQDAGGYVLVGVVSFTAAVVITALCMRSKYKNRGSDRKKEDSEE